MTPIKRCYFYAVVIVILNACGSKKTLIETSHLPEKIENKSNSIDNQLNEELNKIVPFSSTSDKKTITPNLSQNIEAPKEIIYLYADGKFQRFTPKT